MTPADIFQALGPVVAVLDQLGIRYHVGGSLASSAYGAPRATADVDVMADLRLEHAADFVQRLEAAYYVDLEAVREAIRRRRSFNLVHLETMVKVDVFVPEARPFAAQELNRARPQVLDPSEGAPPTFVKSAEDLVLRKLERYRAGGETSERQWADVLGVLNVQRGRLDRAYLAHWAAELGLADLLERALSEAHES